MQGGSLLSIPRVTVMILRISIPFLLAIAAWASLVQAQVASPPLRPGAMQVTSRNPATLQWNRTAIWLGQFEGTNRFFNAAGNPTNGMDLDGPLAGLRWVGENHALGAERLTIDFIQSNPGTNPTTDSVLTQAAFAGQVGGWFAVGVGIDNRVDNFALGNQRSNDINIAGISLRMGEVFYVGASTGKETGRRNFVGFGPQVFQAQRDLTRSGVAFRWRDEGYGFRLEAYSESRDPFRYELPGGVVRILDEIEENSGVVEVVVANILVGAQARNITTSSNTPPANPPKRDEERRAVMLGWVPADGFSAVLRWETRESKDTPSGATQKRTRRRITVSWHF